MSIITAHPETQEQAVALKAIMKALKIKSEVNRAKKYDPVFVEKINESRQQALDGKVTRIQKQDLKKILSH